MSMSLMELCEPVFLEICRVNRQMRQPDRGGPLEPVKVRADFRRTLEEARSRAGGQLGMDSQFAKVEPALVALMDDVVKTGPVSWRQDWKSMYEESFNAAYMDDFYTKLEELIAEPPSEVNRDRMAVFYTCLGLGFMGKARLDGDDRGLPRRRMSEMRASRIAELVEQTTERPLLPEITTIVDRRQFIRPSTDPLIPAAIALVVMTLGLILGTMYLYSEGKRGLSTPLEQIRAMDEREAIKRAKEAGVGAGGKQGGKQVEGSR
jgi:type VI protein secretion system component VasF